MKGNDALKRKLSQRSDSDNETDYSSTSKQKQSTPFRPRAEGEDQSPISGGSEQSAVIQQWLHNLERERRTLISPFDRGIQAFTDSLLYKSMTTPEEREEQRQQINSVDAQDSNVHFTPRKVTEKLRSGQRQHSTHSQDKVQDLPILNIGNRDDFYKKIKNEDIKKKAYEIIDKKPKKSTFNEDLKDEEKWKAENEYRRIEREGSIIPKQLLQNQARYEKLIEGATHYLERVGTNTEGDHFSTNGVSEAIKELETCLAESKRSITPYTKPLTELKAWFDHANDEISKEFRKIRLKSHNSDCISKIGGKDKEVKNLENMRISESNYNYRDEINRAYRLRNDSMYALEDIIDMFKKIDNISENTKKIAFDLFREQGENLKSVARMSLRKNSWSEDRALAFSGAGITNSQNDQALERMLRQEGLLYNSQLEGASQSLFERVDSTAGSRVEGPFPSDDQQSQAMLPHIIKKIRPVKL